MFAIIATKPLTDGTKGFRFNILGTKGVLRKRKCLVTWLAYCARQKHKGLPHGQAFRLR
jgi:hypothetical protein